MAAQTSADLQGLYNNFYERSKFVYEQESLMPALVTIRTGQGVAPRILSEYDSVTAGTVAFGGTVTDSNFGKDPDGTVTIERVHAAVLYTRDMATTDPDGYQGSLQRELGQAHARQADTDLVGLFDDFTTTAGAAGSALTVAYLAAGMAKMDAANAPRMERNAVIHPYAYYDLFTQMADAGSTPINSTPIDAVNVAMNEYYQGSLVGARLYTNSHIATGTAAKHGLFTREAIIHDQRTPYTVELEPEPQVDGVRVHALQYYGNAVNRQAAGVEITASAVAPV